jgi:hypothetical protein
MPIIISAIIAAIGGAGTLIAKAIRWGSKQITANNQRSIDALVESARSNARLETLVLSIRDDFRAQIRKIERDRNERERGERSQGERSQGERTSRNQTQPRIVAIQPAEEEKEARETKKRRASTERGAAKSRGRDDEES